HDSRGYLRSNSVDQRERIVQAVSILHVGLRPPRRRILLRRSPFIRTLRSGGSSCFLGTSRILCTSSQILPRTDRCLLGSDVSGYDSVGKLVPDALTIKAGLFLWRQVRWRPEFYDFSQ